MRISIFGLFQCLACRKSHKAFVFRFNHLDNLVVDLASCQNGKQKKMRKKPLMTVRVLNKFEHEDHVMHIELPKAEIS